MTQRDALITKNYIWTDSKINFKIEIFWSEIEVKKIFWNWKIELAKNAEYDSAWFTDHKKLYFSPSKINFQDRNILVRNWGEKNLFEIGK